MKEENRLEFCDLAAQFDLSAKAIGKILRRSPATISRYMLGRQPIPADLLSTLRRVVASIEAAR